MINLGDERQRPQNSGGQTKALAAASALQDVAAILTRMAIACVLACGGALPLWDADDRDASIGGRVSLSMS
ncbi:MAG: hypothetical protein DME33_04530 [Verrucomicrobia bacterium]|nr:MAG: hypothetical protein DME33_04530 [Verrucomicrobiota bacterium]